MNQQDNQKKVDAVMSIMRSVHSPKRIDRNMNSIMPLLRASYYAEKYVPGSKKFPKEIVKRIGAMLGHTKPEWRAKFQQQDYSRALSRFLGFSTRKYKKFKKSKKSKNKRTQKK